MYAAVLVLALMDVSGFVSLRGVNATGPQSWLDGGWGRLDAGGDRDELIASAHFGADWTPSKYFDVHVAGAARHDPLGDRAGLVEAYAEGRAALALDELQLRGGQFFLPTSRENKDDLWSSRYTVSFSALNTWIAEEVRPIGADLEYRHVTRAGHTVTGAATAFRGNDTMGALLAWRGWTIGDRLSTTGEALPLPLPSSLDEFFPQQRRDGTQPFGRDLDDRTGYSARVRYSVPERANIQYTWLDTRGDRALHRGEYAWETVFHLISLEAGRPDGVTVAAEYMKGTTGMGHVPAFVDAGFYAGYVLASARRGRNRWTARYELFATDERDFSIAESNEENGRSWTLTWMFDALERMRLAFEFTQFSGARPGTRDPDGRSFTAETRYRF